MEQILRCRSVILRDRRPSDVDDYVRWNCVKTWWKNWDAPWENTRLPSDEDPVQRETRIRGLLLAALDRTLPPVRTHFDVDGPSGAHLGWVNRYRTGETKDLIAIGIDLPDLDRGGRGIGTIAFSLHAAYRFRMEESISELYTETWSGNLPMIGLALRTGFLECGRKNGNINLQGRSFDSLRFAVDAKRLFAHCPWLEESEFLAT